MHTCGCRMFRTIGKTDNAPKMKFREFVEPGRAGSQTYSVDLSTFTLQLGDTVPCHAYPFSSHVGVILCLPLQRHPVGLQLRQLRRTTPYFLSRTSQLFSNLNKQGSATRKPHARDGVCLGRFESSARNRQESDTHNTTQNNASSGARNRPSFACISCYVARTSILGPLSPTVAPPTPSPFA